MSHQIFHVRASDKGQTLAAVLKRELGVSWNQARQLIAQRTVRLAGAVCTDGVRRVQPGMEIQIVTDENRKKPRQKLAPPRKTKSSKPKRDDPKPALVFLDEHIVVVEKPAGLTTMRHAEEAAEFGKRAKKYLPPTLADMLPALIGEPEPVLAVHRLDRDTSGLVVFARTKESERDLGQQFRAHTIKRKYLAIVRGKAKPARIESHIARDRGDGRRGSTTNPEEGQRAVTHVRVIEELDDYTLVECELETGRTHQVRIHLAEQGSPLCGETVYDRPLHGAPRPDKSKAPHIALHAATLGLHHPATGEWREWQSPLPDDLAELLRRLRKN
ncbi:MAG TPA: RluA family pseudouridine synthase [Gemmataceae bacterium]|nr:RluA family pseudouridine synthase [Gemmataceae bacterium]